MLPEHGRYQRLMIRTYKGICLTLCAFGQKAFPPFQLASQPSHEGIMAKVDEQYSDQESEQRFRKLVGIALKSPPKPQKMNDGPEGCGGAIQEGSQKAPY